MDHADAIDSVMFLCFRIMDVRLDNKTFAMALEFPLATQGVGESLIRWHLEWDLPQATPSIYRESRIQPPDEHSLLHLQFRFLSSCILSGNSVTGSNNFELCRLSALPIHRV